VFVMLPPHISGFSRLQPEGNSVQTFTKFYYLHRLPYPLRAPSYFSPADHLRKTFSEDFDNISEIITLQLEENKKVKCHVGVIADFLQLDRATGKVIHQLRQLVPNQIDLNTRKRKTAIQFVRETRDVLQLRLEEKCQLYELAGIYASWLQIEPLESDLPIELCPEVPLSGEKNGASCCDRAGAGSSF
jgi:hypothetical protein